MGKLSQFRDENIEDTFSRISLFDNYFSIKKQRVVIREAVDCTSIGKIMEYGKRIKEQKQNFKRLINEFDTLNYVDFFYLYKDLYYWDNVEILKRYADGMFKNPIEQYVRTDDFAQLTQQEGSGRDFSWWTDTYHAVYKVIVDKANQLEDRVYKKEEIAKLVNENKLIVVSKDGVYGNRVSSEEYQKYFEKLSNIKLNTIKLNYSFNCYPGYISKNDIKEMFKENKPAFVCIKNSLTKEQLKKDYKKYKEYYDIAVKDLIDNIIKLKKELRKEENEIKKQKRDMDTLIKEIQIEK